MGIQVFWFLSPNNNSIVKITSNNKICLKENQKYRVTYFEVKSKSITLQGFAEKQKYHVGNEKSCVMVTVVK